MKAQLKFKWWQYVLSFLFILFMIFVILGGIAIAIKFIKFIWLL